MLTKDHLEQLTLQYYSLSDELDSYRKKFLWPDISSTLKPIDIFFIKSVVSYYFYLYYCNVKTIWEMFEVVVILILAYGLIKLVDKLPGSSSFFK